MKSYLSNDPVAWRIFDGEGGYDYVTIDDDTLSYRDDWMKHHTSPIYKDWIKPLYLRPQVDNASVAEILFLADNYASCFASLQQHEARELLKEKLMSVLAVKRQ